LDKHLRAHNDIQQAVQELIDAIELIEGLVVTDETVRTNVTRKLTRSKMLLSEARQEMRWSRIGEPRAVHGLRLAR
jgi:hypothetical protein